MLQSITSANTSVNNTKIPAAFTAVRPYGHICDYGAGKFTEHIRRYCMEHGATGYSPYDPFNQPISVNETTTHDGETRGFDTVYLCNVLNVINSDNIVWHTLYTAFSWVKHYGRLIIQIYEGDKSGDGRETKRDCFQRNERAAEYEKFFGAFQGASFTYERKGNIWIIKKGA